jgi:hypothetical protein
MHYASGEAVLPGDRVDLDGWTGVVVAVIEDGLYSSEYPEDEWSYLVEGLLIETDQVGLLHYPKMGDDVTLIARTAPV